MNPLNPLNPSNPPNPCLRPTNLGFNSLSANPEKWLNTLKQIVPNLPTICLSVFDHFMNLALKGLKKAV